MRAISYSGLQLYANCPSAFERKYILKEAGGPRPTEAEAPAMYRGTRVHNGIEEYLENRSEELPPEVDFYKDFFRGIRGESMLRPEMPWAFDANWEAVDFKSDDAVIRGLIDTLLYDTDDNIIYLYEYKTGKVYPDHIEQANLYGLAALLAFPAARAVYGDIMYLDAQKNVHFALERALVPSYQWLWNRRIQRTQPPQSYRMRPSWRCKGCAFNVSRGGKCRPPAKGD